MAFKIPPGSTLYAVNQQDGSKVFYASYQVYGVQMFYEIGDGKALNEQFAGGKDYFNQFETIRSERLERILQNQGILAGSVSELAGQKESVRSMIDRQLKEYGLEDMPSWLASSPQAMLVMMKGAEDEWSSGRIWKELSSTGAFKKRFNKAGLDAVGARGAATLEAQVQAYYEQEDALRRAILTSRGEQANVSSAYLGKIIGIGWEATEVEGVLDAERRFRANPNSLTRLNKLLEYQGMETLSGVSFIDLMRGEGSPEVFEVLNDAMRREALLEAGVRITDTQASNLGTGTSTGLAVEGSYTESARIAALEMIRNRHDFGRFGLTKGQVVNAAFGEGDAATEAILAKLGRERAAASEGFEGIQSFQDERGRLRTQGLSAL